MKTRSLILLALGCGVAIMLAGAVFLFQLTNQDELETPVPVGERATVGDMSVTVTRASEVGGVLDISVRIGGVDDEDGSSGFRLIASGRPLTPDPAARPDSAAQEELCGATETEPQACVIRFDVSGSDGDSRVLFYERGDDRARWVLG